MEAKDLRIDNIAICSGEFCKITSFNTSTAWIEYFESVDDRSDVQEVDLDSLEAVELSEEILLKIEQAIPESYLNLSFTFNEHSKIWVDKSNEEKPIWHYVWKKQYIEVKYLHHLQNIHYYLNNFEELNISL